MTCTLQININRAANNEFYADLPQRPRGLHTQMCKHRHGHTHGPALLDFSRNLWPLWVGTMLCYLLCLPLLKVSIYFFCAFQACVSSVLFKFVFFVVLKIPFSFKIWWTVIYSDSVSVRSFQRAAEVKEFNSIPLNSLLYWWIFP